MKFKASFRMARRCCLPPLPPPITQEAFPTLLELSTGMTSNGCTLFD